MFLCEPEQHRRDTKVTERDRHADLQAAARLTVSALEFGFCRIKLGKRPNASVVVGLSSLRQRLTARRAME